MSFQNESNRGRVAKMIEVLDLVEKSARSNRTTIAEVEHMLAPLLARLGCYGAGAPADEGPAKVAGTPPAPGSHCAWGSIREMAEQADLRDLSAALAVYLNRVDEALNPPRRP